VHEEVTVPVSEPRCATYCALHQTSLQASDTGATPLNCACCYTRDVRDGFLRCRKCHTLYPIIAGVPRVIRNAAEEYKAFFDHHRVAIAGLSKHEDMVGQPGKLDPSTFDHRSNESFSLQWEKYQYHDKTWFKDDQDLRRREFLYNMDLRAEQLQGALLLDAGCGNGRLTAAVAGYGAEVVGMDLSRSVARAEEHRLEQAGSRAAFLHFVQGNIMEPPLVERAFDHIHTSGVLHHTPDTERAFRSFLTLGRPGGQVYVQLYRRREAWVRIPNAILRFFTCRMPVRFLYCLCYAMVPLHTALVLLVARCRGEKSPIREASMRERAVSMFDHFSPRYQYRYTPEQMRRMFEAAGLVNIKDVTLANEARHVVAFVGNKRAARDGRREFPATAHADGQEPGQYAGVEAPTGGLCDSSGGRSG
jgi:SAM-dependent methyltransferase